jgi:hypothetical protein
MIATVLTIPYTSPADAGQWVQLEQEPVADGPLNLKDLARMLALVRAGVSAHAYRSPACPCSVVAGSVRVPLTVYVWPSQPGMAYQLEVSAGTLTGPEVVLMDREFSLVIDFATMVELPFHAEAITWAWADMPCFDRFGNEVERPTVAMSATEVLIGAEVLGVLRIRCVAVGFKYGLELVYPKTEATRVRSASPTITALWSRDGATVSESLSLDIPACAEDLLAACDDGRLRLRTEAIHGEVSESEGLVPVLYYNECTGQAFPVQYQRP